MSFGAGISHNLSWFWLKQFATRMKLFCVVYFWGHMLLTLHCHSLYSHPKIHILTSWYRWIVWHWLQIYPMRCRFQQWSNQSVGRAHLLLGFLALQSQRPTARTDSIFVLCHVFSGFLGLRSWWHPRAVCFRFVCVSWTCFHWVMRNSYLRSGYIGLQFSFRSTCKTHSGD